MSVAAKPRRTLMVRLVASMKKAGAVNTAANDHSDGAERRIAELSNRPTVSSGEIREMTPTKHFPNENVEETRRVHVKYLEDKKKEFAELLEKLKKEKDMLEGDEAEHVYMQWWVARRKEALTRDFDNILKEEREAMHAQVKKNPQEVEAERFGGAPSLQTRIERLDEAKRKVLLSLREVEDEELGNVDEGKQLRTKREELARRTKETEQKLASVEETLRKVNQAMMEQEAAQSVRKEQLAAPPAEHDGSTRKRTATQASEESQSNKAKILYGLEEEESEDEDEEHVHRREEPSCEKKAETTDKRYSAHKSVRISPHLNGPVQAEEVGREKAVNAREPPAATAQATQQSSTSTSSPTRRERQPPSADTRISLDELEEAVANMEFQSDEENKIRVACPYCDGKEFCGWAQNICTHFVTHLHFEDRPYRCSQDDCDQTSIQVSDMRTHFKGHHKEQTWNDEMAKLCEVGPNKERLNAIKRLVEERTGRFKEKTFEELEEQAKTCTLERDAEGILRMTCSVCTEQIKADRRSSIRYHLMSHLGHSSLPLRCSEDECQYTASRLQHLRVHFRISHDGKELTKKMEKDCELIDNVKRLGAIVAAIYARRPRKDS